jgi:hypothetical protein
LYWHGRLSLKIQFWLVVSGNSCLYIGFVIIYFLHYFDFYNPWHESKDSIILMPEDIFQNLFFPMMALYGAATLPICIAYITDWYTHTQVNCFRINTIFKLLGKLVKGRIYNIFLRCFYYPSQNIFYKNNS